MEANSTKPAPRVNLFGVRKYVIGSRTLLRASSVYTRIYVIIRLRIQWHSIPSFTSVHIDSGTRSSVRRIETHINIAEEERARRQQRYIFTGVYLCSQ